MGIDVKSIIVDAMLQLCEEKHLKKITIGDIDVYKRQPPTFWPMRPFWIRILQYICLRQLQQVLEWMPWLMQSAAIHRSVL